MTINLDTEEILGLAANAIAGVFDKAAGPDHVRAPMQLDYDAARAVITAIGLAALLSRLEQAEQDRVKLRNRLDAMRRQRDGYQNQLRKTEQQVARVREFSDQLRGYCSPYGVAHDYAKQLDRALDGDQA